MKFSNRELFQIIRNEKLTDYHDFILYIENHKSVVIVDREKVRLFFKYSMKKWNESSRIMERFTSKNNTWLDMEQDIEISNSTSSSPIVNIRRTCAISEISPNKGRPSKSIADCSGSTEKRKLRDHNVGLSTGQIVMSLEQRLNHDQRRDFSKIVHVAHESSPTTVKRMRSSLDLKDSPKELSVEQALALFLSLGLSKEKYQTLRDVLKRNGFNALPSYKKITLAKESEILPEIEVTDSGASVSLQNLLDNTVIFNPEIPEIDYLSDF